MHVDAEYAKKSGNINISMTDENIVLFEGDGDQARPS